MGETTIEAHELVKLDGDERWYDIGYENLMGSSNKAGAVLLKATYDRPKMKVAKDLKYVEPQDEVAQGIPVGQVAGFGVPVSSVPYGGAPSAYP